MKTQEEILKKIKEVEKKREDIFNVMTTTLIYSLTFKNAKPYLKDDCMLTETEWKKTTDETIKKEMIDYMDFAWDKANNFRGISATRTMQYYEIWLWLIGNDELSEKCRDYNFYGKHQLVEICKYLELDYTNHHLLL